jgi:hypothetical protein
MSKPLIGKVLDPLSEYARDAIHVPIMPVVALEGLNPGDKVTLKKTDRKDKFFGAEKSISPVGVVDPFLKFPVKVGERFYCWVKPGTVHKLWHEWTHPVLDRSDR